MRVKGLKIIFTLSLVLAITPVVLADSAQESVNQGNRLYNKGSFSEAIKEYDEALIDQPQTLEPKFNQANCYFQLDDLSKAIDLYNEVAAESKNMELVAKAKYNLGNSYFQRGIKQKDSNLQKALEDLQSSIMYWRAALDIDPENEKAAKNIEVARLIIKDIIDQINKQKQQQEEQAAQQKQLQEQLKEILEQQKALANQTQQTQNQEDSGKINQLQAAENYTKQAEQQSQLKKQTEQTSQQIQQQDPNNQIPQLQQAVYEINKAVDKQMDAEEQLNTSEGNSAKQAQDKAIEHLENAMKALSGDSQQGQQQQQQEQQSQQGQQDPNEAQQEQQQEQQQAVAPDTTAEDILNKEQQEKKRRQILQRSGYQKVEKDW